jgi:hypothetical protein
MGKREGKEGIEWVVLNGELRIKQIHKYTNN